jgi:hypothetical protein
MPQHVELPDPQRIRELDHDASLPREGVVLHLLGRRAITVSTTRQIDREHPSLARKLRHDQTELPVCREQIVYK